MLCNDIRDAFSRLLACNFIKSNTTPWVFFMYFKLYKWYQIPQSITYNMFWEEKLSQAGQKNPKYWYKIFLHKSYGLKHETSTTAVDWHLKVKNKKCDVALIKNYCITVSMQKISSIHKLIQQILGPHELNDRSHFWPDPPKKSLGYFLLSWICTTLQKISFVPSIHSWDTANFRVQWPHCSHSFLTTPMQKIFDHLLIDLNLHQHAKKQAISLTCSGDMVD